MNEGLPDKYVILKVISELIKFLSLSNPLELCSDCFPSRLCQRGGISKDPTVRLNGASEILNYIFINSMSSVHLKI